MQDGRKSVNHRTLKVLQLMGVYSEGALKNEVAGKAVQVSLKVGTVAVFVLNEGLDS